MTRGELEARILDGDRVLASAPPDVSRELRFTGQAEADAWQQSTDTDIKHDQAGSASAKALARLMATQRQQLEAANADYEGWAANTRERREAAGGARAELERRRLAQRTLEQRQPEAEGEPPTMVEWWRQLEADLTAVDRVIEREHEAAEAAGKPWPPARTPQLDPERMTEPESVPRSDPEADGQPGLYDQAVRPDELIAHVTEAAQRFTAENAARKARAEYTARFEREASVGSEHAAQAEASYEADIEL